MVIVDDMTIYEKQDCPKVVDEVEMLAKWAIEETESKRMNRVWKAGYNKSQETHPFSLSILQKMK